MHISRERIVSSNTLSESIETLSSRVKIYNQNAWHKCKPFPKSKLTLKQARRQELLEEFDFNIKYKIEQTNKVVDSVSQTA